MQKAITKMAFCISRGSGRCPRLSIPAILLSCLVMLLHCLVMMFLHRLVMPFYMRRLRIRSRIHGIHTLVGRQGGDCERS